MSMMSYPRISKAQTFFAKIDYFDLTLSYDSENPADLAVINHVMTIMCADDY
jgi:hypothetical protein